VAIGAEMPVHHRNGHPVVSLLDDRAARASRRAGRFVSKATASRRDGPRFFAAYSGCIKTWRTLTHSRRAILRFAE
jgi:hypothetical protein